MSALVEYLTTDVKPDLIHLSNALISGIIPLVQDRLKAPIVVELQGDDIFLDGLLPHHKTKAIEAIRVNTARVARFHTPCADYADYMSDYLGIDRSRFRVVPLGIDLAGYQNIPQNRPANHPPTIGFFARMCPEKGLDLLVDAWLKLRKRPGLEQVRLQVGGWLGGGNIPFWEAQLAKAKAAGQENGLVHRPCLTLAEKSAFYSDCDLVSVPTKMREPKGLYLLEAWAHGKPVVQPEFGSFPELVGATGGGLLVPRENAEELAEKIEQLLKDPTHAKHIGETARKAVAETFTSKQMAQNTVKSYTELLSTSF
jgi:glycosyltransferase involved in cell wall biosynthesis